MNLDPEVLCPRCAVQKHAEDKVLEESKAEATELRMVRTEGLTAAARFLEDPKRDWPEDGRPVPSDYLNLAAFLSGEVDDG